MGDEEEPRRLEIEVADKGVETQDVDLELLGEGGIEGERDEPSSVPSSRFPPEEDESFKTWKDRSIEGEYGEGGFFVMPSAREDEEEFEYPPILGEAEYGYEPSESAVSSYSLSEVEETEEEKAARLERDTLIEDIKQKLNERLAIRRRNIYLHKKLTEHFKKRRMDHVLKEDPKGLELESKYLKRLYVFQEFKESQENEIYALSTNMDNFKNDTDNLEEELEETLTKFIQRQKEASIGLISSKTGKKINEKVVDRLLRRQVQKCEEKGKLKLKYVRIKNLIEEKENQLKEMENFGEGLHIMDYEQLKIDNQNYTDKIEEKEEELAKLRVKTHGNIQNLAQVREKAYAIEGDIELKESKFYEVESEFNSTRERVGRAKKKRDELREEYAHLKMVSGLLTNNLLLKDFEQTLFEKERVDDIVEEMKSLLREKRKKQTQLENLVRKPNLF